MGELRICFGTGCERQRKTVSNWLLYLDWVCRGGDMELEEGNMLQI
jgi:predicted Fe-S protein YdhL (DUF1289 family)